MAAVFFRGFEGTQRNIYLLSLNTNVSPRVLWSSTKRNSTEDRVSPAGNAVHFPRKTNVWQWKICSCAELTSGQIQLLLFWLLVAVFGRLEVPWRRDDGTAIGSWMRGLKVLLLYMEKTYY